MTPIMLRAATAEDLPAILEIYNHAIAHTTAIWLSQAATLESRRAWWQAREAAGFPTFVAVHDDHCVGYASYGTFRDGPGYRFTCELSIYVDKDHRGKGIADKLMVALEEHARARGVHVLVGGLEAGNEASIALHRKHGYQEVGLMPQVGHKFDRWLDLLLMQKVLD